VMSTEVKKCKKKPCRKNIVSRVNPKEHPVEPFDKEKGFVKKRTGEEIMIDEVAREFRFYYREALKAAPQELIQKKTDKDGKIIKGTGKIAIRPEHRKQCLAIAAVLAGLKYSDLEKNFQTYLSGSEIRRRTIMSGFTEIISSDKKYIHRKS